jgi:outer membrane protein
MKRLLSIALLIVGSIVGAATPAFADSSNAFIHLGATRVKLLDRGKLYENGVYDPSAAYTTNEAWTATLEGGVFVHGPFAIQGSIAAPTTTHNIPAGSLAGLPNLGNDQFIILTGTATWHPLRGHRISPYLGAGVGAEITTKTRDGLAQNLRVGNSVGPVVQGGIDFDVTRHAGVFIDAKKAFYKADASGDIGPVHVVSRAKLDPIILQAGVLFRF